MSAPDAAEEAKPAKPKSKKLLIIVALVVVLLGAAVAGWVVYSRMTAHAEDPDAEETPAAASHAAAAHGPPTFLPLDNMVVNLADPGGERMAQIGITIEMADAKSAEKVKSYLPSIRSGILMLISQRTATDLLKREGKEELAKDILKEVSKPLGFTVEEHSEAAPKKGEAAAGKKKSKEKAEPNPVQGVLFSSFIVQ